MSLVLLAVQAAVLLFTVAVSSCEDNVQHGTGFSELDPRCCFYLNGLSFPLGRTRLTEAL